MPTDTEASVAVGAGDAQDPARRSERIAFWMFVAYLVVALPLLLWMGSYRWFLGDEWSFLADRSVSLDLFRPHNQQHWVTLPVLVYRGLYSIVGLRVYWPYQLVVIALHLTAAALLRVVMRRAGVGPWIATVVAGMFVLLGPAEDNILWAFQITFVGSLVLGITQLILADHPGPIDRRDWIGLGVGLAALMVSGQSPSLIFAVGLACVLRRRWAAAVMHTVPLAVVFMAWAWLEDATTFIRVDEEPFTFHEYVNWMINAASGLFLALGHYAPLAVLFAVLFVGGNLLAWRSEGSAAFFGRAAAPTALVAACIVSMSSAAPSRFFFGPEAARSGRYIGVMAALTLPALAVATDAVARRWPRVMPVLLALLLLSFPFNATGFRSDEILTARYFDGTRDYVSGLSVHPLVTRVPPWVRPNATLVGQPDMTTGWLLSARRENKLPPPGQLSSIVEQRLPIQLGVAQPEDDAPEGLSCTVYDSPVAVDPELGDRFAFGTPARVAGRVGDSPSTRWQSYSEGVVEITLPDLHLLVSPPDDANDFELCR